jgi:hypothetical protein
VFVSICGGAAVLLVFFFPWGGAGWGTLFLLGCFVWVGLLFVFVGFFSVSEKGFVMAKYLRTARNLLRETTSPGVNYMVGCFLYETEGLETLCTA